MAGDVAVLAAFGLMCFALALVGGLAGLVLGNLRLPLAVSTADTVAAGGGANVAISGVAAATAAVTHIRAGRIDWRLWGWLAPTSLVGGFAGGVLASVVPAGALLVAISAILFYSSYELFNWQPREAGDAPAAGGPALTRQDHLRASAIGLVVGLLGGAVGLILGTLRLPALLKFTTVQPRVLIGTNLLAGVVVAIAGAVGHLTSGADGFDWQLFVIGAVASIPGAWYGARLTGRLPVATLIRAIAAILIVVGSAMLAEGIVKLA